MFASNLLFAPPEDESHLQPRYIKTVTVCCMLDIYRTTLISIHVTKAYSLDKGMQRSDIISGLRESQLSAPRPSGRQDTN